MRSGWGGGGGAEEMGAEMGAEGRSGRGGGVGEVERVGAESIGVGDRLEVLHEGSDCDVVAAGGGVGTEGTSEFLRGGSGAGDFIDLVLDCKPSIVALGTSSSLLLGDCKSGGGHWGGGGGGAGLLGFTWPPSYSSAPNISDFIWSKSRDSIRSGDFIL